MIELIAEGYSDKDIAREMDMQLATVKAAVRGIYRIKGVRSRTQLAVLFHTGRLPKAVQEGAR